MSKSNKSQKYILYDSIKTRQNQVIYYLGMCVCVCVCVCVKLSQKANKLVLKFQDNGYSVSKNNKPGGGGKGGGDETGVLRLQLDSMF